MRTLLRYRPRRPQPETFPWNRETWETLRMQLHEWMLLDAGKTIWRGAVRYAVEDAPC